MTTLACPCCGWEYEMGSGVWWLHDCSGRGRGKPEQWSAQWCRLDDPKAAPRDGACGKCPKHCECASRNPNNLPKMEPNEGIQQFIFRMKAAPIKAYRPPHNSE